MNTQELRILIDDLDRHLSVVVKRLPSGRWAAIPPLVPGIFVEHINAQRRKDRKT